MNTEKLAQILSDTAFIRTGGSEEELRCARYLSDQFAEFGCKAEIQPFEVDLSELKPAKLVIDGKEYPCKGYTNVGCADLEAPLYYLRGTDKQSYAGCKGKVVLFDGYLGTWRYHDLVEAGAVGFISHNGHVNYADRDIDQREVRAMAIDKAEGKKIPGVNINIKDAVEIVRSGAKTARIVLEQREYKGESRNVVVDLPGEVDEWISVTGHYDSTPLSVGTYDNMSGALSALAIGEYFTTHAHRYGIRVILFGSEERGLLGSKAYVKDHPEDIAKMVLNINIDMVGCIMGKFIAGVTAEERLCHYIEYMGAELGFPVKATQMVYSSDSTPFADAGVPAFTFARDADECGAATIHDRYDTMAVMSPEQMAADIDFMAAFADRMANAKYMPVAREIPEKMKEDLDKYLARKR